MLRFLKVQFQALTDDFNNSIKSAQREAKEFEKTIKPTKQLLHDVGTAATAAGLAIVGGMTAAAKAAANYGDALNDAAQRTGASVQELAKLKFAAEQSGASFEDVSAGLRVLARNAQEAASGSKAQAAAFRDLGISVTDSAGKIRPLNSLLLDVSDRFAHMEDSAEKAAIAQDLFGRGGTALIPTLNAGREGLQAMGDQAERLGLVISTEAALAGDQFNDTLTEMQGAMTGLANVIGGAILPALTDIAKKATDLIVDFKNWSRENETLTKAIFAVGGALLGAGGLALGLSTVLGSVGKVSVAMKGLATFLGPVGIGFAAAAAGVIYFRNELGIGLRSALATSAALLEKFTSALATIAPNIGPLGGFSTRLHESSFRLGEFRIAMEKANEEARIQLSIIPDLTTVMKPAAKATDDYSFSLKRTNEEAAATTKKLAEMREELEKDQLAFERSASLDFWKSQQEQLAGYETGMRRANAAVLDMVKSQKALRDELADAGTDLNKRVQDELDAQTRRTNKETIDGILKASDERLKAIEKEKRAQEKAAQDIKRSAGAIFDAMFIKGESVFKSLGNALKGGALSLGRAIFEDITAALLGPIKKAFDDFLAGILGGITKNLGSKLAGALGIGGGAMGDWQGPVQAAGGIGGGIGGGGGSVAGGAGGLTAGLIGAAGGIIGGGLSALATMRTEGTLNAIEFNTRATEIHARVAIEQLLWPIRNYSEVTANAQGEHTNQLDAIFKAITGTASPGSVYQTGRVFAGQAAASAAAPPVVINATFAPVVNVPASASLTREELMTTLLESLDINFRGSLEQLVQLIRGAAPGVVAGVA